MKLEYPLWRYSIAISLIIVLILGLNWLSLRIEPEGYEEKILIEDVFKKSFNNEIEAINLGGSTGRGLNFAQLGLNGENLTCNGQDLFQDEALLKIIIEHNTSIKKVFLTTGGPTDMMINNTHMFYYPRIYFYRITKKYRSIYPLNNDWGMLIHGNYLPLLREDHWKKINSWNKFKMLATKLIEEKLDFFYIDKESIFYNYNKPHPESLLDLTPKKRLMYRNDYDLQTHQALENKYYKPNSSNESMNSLIRICELAHKNNLDLIIYTPPATDIYKQKTLSLYMEGKTYWDNALEKCQENGALYLSWEDDEKYMKEHKYFSDYHHLNQKGSLIFNEDMLKRLIKNKKTKLIPNVQSLISSMNDYNILRYKNIYYAIPQKLVNVDLENDDLSKFKGIVISKSLSDLEEKIKNSVPILISSIYDYNIVKYQNQYYAIPQRLGKIELEHDDLSKFKSIIISKQLSGLEEEIKNSVPILISSINNYNIVKYRNRYYAIPQKLGKVDFVTDDLSKFKGIIISEELSSLEEEVK